MPINFYVDGCPKCRQKRPQTARGPMNRCAKCGYEDSDDFRVALEQKQAETQEKLATLKAKINVEKADGAFSMQKLMSLHVGEVIGINVLDPSKTVSALLLDAQADHFCVATETLHHYIPYSQIIRVVATPDGKVISSGLDEFLLMVTVFDMVIYKGAVGIGFSIPI